jgi:dihydrofolate synthase / folylpolyglutamate synthase
MLKFNTLQSWLSHLEQAHTVNIDMGLDRIKQLLPILNFDKKIPIITVAGTNGKGSTSHFLSTILTCAHYEVGLYTSPHLLCFNERVRINNHIIDDELLMCAFEHIEAARASINISLSYFEFTTLAAVWIFYNCHIQRPQNYPRPLEAIVLEVGLGGRLDATNIFDPIVSIITNVGLDHIEYLGDTREKIALEKAGILRQNVPFICGDKQPPHTLRAYANSIQAPAYYLGGNFLYETEESQWHWRSDDKNIHSLPHPTLKGMNQLNNASCAIMALLSIKHILPVSHQDIRRGLVETELNGRFSIIPGQPVTVLDVAHNADAGSVLADNLDRMGFYQKNIAILGAMQDKDIVSMLTPLKNIIDEWHICLLPTNRSASLEQLEQAILSLYDDEKNKDKIKSKLKIYTYTNVLSAYAYVKQHIQKEHRLLVFGSFYTVAGVYPYLHMQNNVIMDELDKQNNIHKSQTRIKSFVRRNGRVTPSQQKALQDFSAQSLLAYQNKNIFDCISDLQSNKNNTQNKTEIIVEIGFGMGETTAYIAKNAPHKQFIAIEVHTAGVGALLKRMHAENIQNIHIVQHDAVEVLETMFENASIDGIHIFFPDPWHKSKHHKRRLIQAPFIDLIIQKLKPQGYIHCATDWQNYAEHILNVLSQNTLLQNTSTHAHAYADKPSYRPTTKFETRGLKLGHGVWDIIFTKL